MGNDIHNEPNFVVINEELGTYEGLVNEIGLKEGRGTFFFKKGDRYEGEYMDDKKHGKGTFYWEKGDIYDGEWKCGNMHGHGVYTGKGGAKYVGQFSYDKFHGFGKLWWASGNRYEGEYRMGKKHGKGVYYYRSGNRYEGEFENDRFTGKGTMYYIKSGNRFVGEYKNGKPNGEGFFYELATDSFYHQIYGAGKLLSEGKVMGRAVKGEVQQAEKNKKPGGRKVEPSEWVNIEMEELNVAEPGDENESGGVEEGGSGSGGGAGGGEMGKKKTLNESDVKILSVFIEQFEKRISHLDLTQLQSRSPEVMEKVKRVLGILRKTGIDDQRGERARANVRRLLEESRDSIVSLDGDFEDDQEEGELGMEKKKSGEQSEAAKEHAHYESIVSKLRSETENLKKRLNSCHEREIVSLKQQLILMKSRAGKSAKRAAQMEEMLRKERVEVKALRKEIQELRAGENPLGLIVAEKEKESPEKGQ